MKEYASDIKFKAPAVKPVTIWNRWDEEKRRFVFNHIEYRYQLFGNAPVPRSEAQRKSWPNQTWQKGFAYLLDGKVCYFDA